MSTKLTRERVTFEVMLIVIALGLTCLFWRTGGYKMVILNLFFLPIVLGGYYLGRSTAGVLAFFCVLSVGLVTTLDSTELARFTSPALAYLALTVWGAALGLTALLVGTLCDERAQKLDELHEAYVGVVEVLSKYLQTGSSKAEARSERLAELSQQVSTQLRLSRKEIDDIRVATLLLDLENIEITSQLLSKAMNTLEANPTAMRKHTFLGMDLIHSLGSVLRGAAPLLMNRDPAVRDVLAMQDDAGPEAIPLGAHVIRFVQAYDALTRGDGDRRGITPAQAIERLRTEATTASEREAVQALSQVVLRDAQTAPRPTPVPV
jgi:hypothetical protein